jgi:hypothetical protein
VGSEGQEKEKEKKKERTTFTAPNPPMSEIILGPCFFYL